MKPIAALLPWPPGQYRRMLIGGNALQLALKAGLLEYRFLLYRRTDQSSIAR